MHAQLCKGCAAKIQLEVPRKQLNFLGSYLAECSFQSNKRIYISILKGAID